MLHFDVNPTMKEKFVLFCALKRNMITCPMLKPNVEDNKIAAIYDNDNLCGGALILGSEKPTYLYCFFENPDYCTEQYHHKLKAAISEMFPEIDLFDVCCLKGKNNFGNRRF